MGSNSSGDVSAAAQVLLGLQFLQGLYLHLHRSLKKMQSPFERFLALALVAYRPQSYLEGPSSAMELNPVASRSKVVFPRA